MKKQPPDKPLVDKILFLETSSEYYSYYKNMGLTLKRCCKKLIEFNRRDYYFKYGKEAMNKRLGEIIAKEKPDYVFTWITWDEFDINTLLNLRKLSPKTKTVAIFGDDSAHFENSSRYYSLLFDYSFTTLNYVMKKYRDDGVDTIFSTNLTDIDSFRPLNLKKKYDVTFIGTQKQDQSGRYELIKHLKDSGINVRVYGFGWENYPEFKDIYYGPLKDEEMLKVINESKINLCFSRDNFGKPQQKARVFEVAGCKSFVLAEFAPQYLDYFKEDKELPMFRSKEEMIAKIKYFLKNEKEREEITEAIYTRTKKDYGLYNELRNFILKTRNETAHKDLPKTNKKIVQITLKEINLPLAKIREIVSDFDYISLKTEESITLQYKDYFQVYSLEKSGKDISCCDYYAYSPSLGDYALIHSKYALGLLSKKSYTPLIYPSQLAFTKNYFLKNIDSIRRVMNRKKSIDFLSMDNTSFVSIPLIRIRNFNISNYSDVKDAFSFKFIYKLYAIFHHKKILDAYPLFLFAEALAGKRFILECLMKTLLNKNLWTKIKKAV